MKSYFKFLSRNKAYTFINVAGLVVSLMFIILMGDYTWRQYSIDSWHKNADRIYLMGSENNFFMWPQAADDIKAMCPEVEQTCCVMSQSGKIKHGNLVVEEGGQWIFVLDKNGQKAYRRNIRIGRQNPQYYEVLEGLESGERVVTSGYEAFKDNEVLVLK